MYIHYFLNFCFSLLQYPDKSDAELQPMLVSQLAALLRSQQQRQLQETQQRMLAAQVNFNSVSRHFNKMVILESKEHLDLLCNLFHPNYATVKL